MLQGDFDVPDDATVNINSSQGNVLGANTVGFYGVTPRLNVHGDVHIKVETGNQPLYVTAGGDVVVNGITNALGSSSPNSLMSVAAANEASIITIGQIHSAGQVYISAADGIEALDTNSYIYGDRVELKTKYGSIGSATLPIKSTAIAKAPADSRRLQMAISMWWNWMAISSCCHPNRLAAL